MSKIIYKKLSFTRNGAIFEIHPCITSEMIHHHGASLSTQQTADLLLCHGTQQNLSLSTANLITQISS